MSVTALSVGYNSQWDCRHIGLEVEITSITDFIPLTYSRRAILITPTTNCESAAIFKRAGKA